MIELARIIEYQASLYSYRATQNEAAANQLELLIESTKPDNHYMNWHPLISTPFRYSPPHPHARFRPPYGRNIFYASLIEETALYEHAVHFMKQRMHLDATSETGMRTLFFVDADDKNAIDIKDDSQCAAMMNKNDYSASHQFITANPHASFIIYPSCRDPKNRNNAAILDIKHLHHMPKWEATIKFFYDHAKQQINWLDYQLHISWAEVV